MSTKCASCSQDEYVAERLSAWTTADAALRARPWYNSDNDGERKLLLPIEVMNLARFLVGDTD